MLMHDDRFLAPENLECLRPGTCRLDSAILRLCGKLHLIDTAPQNRAMDNVEISEHSPQEDEFALLSMGAPTPYRRLFFFNNYGDFKQTQGWIGLSERKVARICRKWVRFLASVQARAPQKLLLLKSPAHSWRVAQIRKLFPKARFILIVRQPEDVYESFADMLSSLFRYNALSRKTPVISRAELLENYLIMLNKVAAETQGLPEHAFTVVRYEDLRQDAAGEIRRIYRDLDLGDCQPALEKLKAETRRKSPYKPHRTVVKDFVYDGPEVAAFRAKYGYAVPEVASAQNDDTAAA